MKKASSKKGFSLIELVIVVVIIGIIAAIAIPRMSRGSAGAADKSLAGDLITLRKAIDLYQAEHGGTYPSDPSNQLTQYTDNAGNTSATQDATHIYGPYLRSLPPLPVGAQKGQTVIGVSQTPGTAGFGWIYDPGTGAITANTTSEQDVSNTPYDQY